MAITKISKTVLSDSTFSGYVIKVQGYTNSTRLAIGTSTDELLWGSISFTKLYTNTDLHITGHLQQRGGWYYACRYRFVLINSGNSSTTNYDGFIGHNDLANSSTNSANFARGLPINLYITNQIAGTITIQIRLQNENGAAVVDGQLNPNSSDDSRFPQTKSTLIIHEVVK